jgi:HEAT repeat protein
MRCSLLFVVAAVLTVAGPVRAEPKPAESKSTVVEGKSLQRWVKDIASLDPSVAQKAMQVIMSHYGKVAQKEAGPELIRRLRGSDVSVRTNAAMTIYYIGLAPKDVKPGVTALIERLRNEPGQTVVRFYATLALASLQQDARPAVPILLSVLKDAYSWENRKCAAYALGKVAREPGQSPNLQVVRALINAVENDKAARVRLEAEIALVQLGPPATDREEALQLRGSLFRALKYRARADKEDKVVVIWAHVGLVQTRLDKDYQPHIKAISKLLKDSEVETRKQVALALGSVGVIAPEMAKEVIPTLIGALSDEESVVAGAAAKALVRLDKSLTTRHLNSIAQLLVHDPAVHVRCHAATALGMLHKEALPYLGDLIQALQDKEPEVVNCAAAAIVDMGPDAWKDGVPALTKMKETTKDEIIRATCVAALVQIYKGGDKPKDADILKSP